MTKDEAKPGTAVKWWRYGIEHRGTIVQEPRGNVVIIRDHDDYKRTWASLESLQIARGK